jgi:sec-independent protein translocase protein TatB
MFGVDSSELFLVAVLALIFIGPKELPTTMRTVGRWVGRARAHARHFTSGIENMMREAELEEMEKKWREENERIMREHPVALPYPGAELPPPPPPPQPPPAPEAERRDEPQLPLPEPDVRDRPLP